MHLQVGANLRRVPADSGRQAMPTHAVDPMPTVATPALVASSPQPASPASPQKLASPGVAASLEEALAALDLGEYLEAIREDGFSEAADLWELDDDDVRPTHLHDQLWLIPAP